MLRILFGLLILAGGLGAADISAYERKAEMNPDDAGSQFNLAVVALQAKEFKKGLKAIDRAVKIEPENAEGWELKGQLHLELGEEAAGVKAFEHSLSISPSRARANLALAKIWSKREDKESAQKALKAYGIAAKANPKDPSLCINQGVLFNRVGEEKLALAMFEKASKMEGGQALAARYLCQIYNRTGEFKKAAAACASASKDPKSNAEVHYNLGYAQTRLGLKAEAKKSFEEAAKIDPGFAPALYNLAYYDYETGKLPEALARFRAAAEAKGGDYPEAQYNVAVILGEQGKWGEAADVYKKLLKKDPKNQDAIDNLSYVVEAGTGSFLDQGKDAYEKGDFDAASKAWEQALKLDPQNSTASNFLKKVKKGGQGSQQLASVKKEVRKAVAKQQKTQAEQILSTGLDALAKHKLKDAERLLGFYVQTNPGNNAAVQALFKARSQLRQEVADLLARADQEQDKKLAMGLVNKALELDPSSVPAKNKLRELGLAAPVAAGASQEELKKIYFTGVDAYLEGDLRKAINIWKGVLAQDPGHLDAQRSLNQAEIELKAIEAHNKPDAHK